MKKWLWLGVLVLLCSTHTHKFYAMRNWDHWFELLYPQHVPNPIIDAVDANDLNQIKKLSQEYSSESLTAKRALLHAAEKAKWDVVEYLLEIGYDPNAEDGVCDKPILYYAVSQKNFAAINLLIERNVIVSAEAICWLFEGLALDDEHIVILRLLLTHISNINEAQKHINWWSNLLLQPKNITFADIHDAAFIQEQDIKTATLKKKAINLLLFHGANPYLENASGQTAIDIMKSESKGPELAQHMENARSNLVVVLTNLLLRISPKLPKDIARYIAELRYPIFQKKS